MSNVFYVDPPSVGNISGFGSNARRQPLESSYLANSDVLGLGIWNCQNAYNLLYDMLVSTGTIIYAFDQDMFDRSWRQSL
jgi:hypothetical protein